MDLPKVSDLDVKEKKVLIRADLDIPEDDNFRLKSCLDTYKYLLSNNASLIIIGHKGRPVGKVDKKLSLLPIVDIFRGLLEKEVNFIENIFDIESQSRLSSALPGQVFLLENIRFDPREEENDSDFAKDLANLGDFFVNEAFANSHRQHASIVGIPRYIQGSIGFRFFLEVANISRVFENPKRPVLVVLSGVKEDKLEYLEGLKRFADKILIAGRLPEYLEGYSDDQVMVADLIPDKEDITINTIEEFAKEIDNAKTIVVSGPVGKYEDAGHRQGTQIVLKKIAQSGAYKVAGGGDTEAALEMFGLRSHFDWVSVGGGAMLEFLAKGTLPGIEVLLKR